jgi:hypothetical protein
MDYKIQLKQVEQNKVQECRQRKEDIQHQKLKAARIGMLHEQGVKLDPLYPTKR